MCCFKTVTFTLGHINVPPQYEYKSDPMSTKEMLSYSSVFKHVAVMLSYLDIMSNSL